MGLKGKTWRNIEPTQSEKIRELLVQKGGEEEETKSPHEEWRIKLYTSTFTYYKKGTLYSTPPQQEYLKQILGIWEEIGNITGSIYVLPTKDFLIGLDETGKGELIGHTVLTGVILPASIFKEIELIVGPADTKKHHIFNYWDNLYVQLNKLRDSGLDFDIGPITPQDVDKYNLNKILDITYQRILGRLIRKVEISRCRIVVDNYGIGEDLEKFLGFLEKKGAEVIKVHNADDQYLEVKVASIISKWYREAVINAINNNPEFQIDGVSVGSGNAADLQTIKWLQLWWKRHKKWPWFVKRSFKTVKDIENKTEDPQKEYPTLNEMILSEKFLDQFRDGKLSIQSLEIICPKCGAILKELKYVGYKDKEGNAHAELRCPRCNEPITDAASTLKYYCGYLLPDTSVIRRGTLSTDLANTKLFRDFTIVLSAVVRKESDKTPGAKREIGRIGKFAAVREIQLETPGKIKDIPEDIPSEQRDEMIIEDCKKHNAILFTADGSMKSFAIGKNVFVIFKS